MGLHSPTGLFHKAIDLAKTQDFVGGKKIIELLDDTNERYAAYIRLIAEQVKVGDLAGAKATVYTAPGLWIGGHWVRCLLGPLVKSGDLPGAFEIIERMTDFSQGGFHKRVIIALQTMAGDLSGARDTLQMILPGEGHRDGALSIIAEAEVRRGDFRSAMETAGGIVNIDDRAEVVGTIQRRTNRIR